jgi:hypothetical protein
MFLPSVILIIFLHLSISTFGSDFVKISATWSWLATCTNSTFLSFTWSRIKRKWMSMCLFLLWFTAFFVNLIADLLSSWITVALNCFSSILLNKFLSHIAWHTHQDAATYSASRVENVTIGYFFEGQVNVVSPIKNPYPNVLFNRLCLCTNRCRSSQPTCNLLLSSRTTRMTLFLECTVGFASTSSNVNKPAPP